MFHRMQNALGAVLRVRKCLPTKCLRRWIFCVSHRQDLLSRAIHTTTDRRKHCRKATLGPVEFAHVLAAQNVQNSWFVVTAFMRSFRAFNRVDSMNRVTTNRSLRTGAYHCTMWTNVSHCEADFKTGNCATSACRHLSDTLLLRSSGTLSKT